IYVCAKDNAGNFSAWKEETYYLDTAKPSVTETVIGNTAVNRSTNIALSGTVSDSTALAAEGTVVVKAKSSDTVLSTKTADLADLSLITSGADSGKYSWNASFSAGSGSSDITEDGNITIEITVKDAAGKETAISRSVTVDTTAPTVSITKNPLATENAVSPYQFGGSSGDGEGTGVTEVWVTTGSTAPAKGITSGAVKATGTGTWYASVTLSAEGSGKVYVCAKDNAGNFSEWTEEEYFFDTSAPVVASGAAATSVTGTLMSLSGSASDNSGIASVSVTQSLNGGIGVSLGNAAVSGGTWTIENLPRKSSSTGTGASTDGSDDGKYTYTITATDNAGKTSSITRTIVLDNTPPAIEIIAPAAGEALEANTKTLKGTASDAGSGVSSVSYEIKKGGETVSSGSTADGEITLPGETWQADNVSLGTGQGTLVLKITAVDEKGNSINTERTFYVDNAYPGIDEKSIGTAGKTVKSGFKLAGLVRDTNALDSTAAVTISAEGYDGEVLGVSSLTLITGDNHATYAVYGADIDKANEGNWSYVEKSFTPGSTAGQLADGTYTFTITAKDTAGKQTPIMRNITVDTAAPVFTAGSFSIEEDECSGSDGNIWYGSTVLTPSIEAGDALSGVQKVSWESGTTNSNGTLGGTKGSGQFIKGDDETWSGTVNLAEGLNYIKIT
ncbi:MAG: Ig-like domain repeat protein, partial [Ruminococcus sp.]|nr:Ig-like domain repeat protein [Ruminococcus sp.]